MERTNFQSLANTFEPVMLEFVDLKPHPLKPAAHENVLLVM